MPKVRPLQSVFTGGEISPKAYGRIQSDMYFQSLKRLRNFVVEPRGGVRDRPGMKKLIDKTNSSLGSPKAVMAPFEIDGDGYVLWIEDHSFEGSFIHVIKDGVILQSLGSPWKNDPNNGILLGDLRWDYRDNVVYFVHPAYKPHRLVFSRASGSFSLSKMDVDDGIFGPFNEDEGLTFTVTKQTDLNNGSVIDIVSSKGIFEKYHQGRRWRLYDGIIEADLVTSATEIQATIIDNTNIAEGATAQWAPPGWSSLARQYTYAWEQVSGDTDINIDTPDAKSTTFSHDGQGTKTGVFRCKVTDDAGNSEYTANVSVTIEHGVFEVTAPNSVSKTKTVSSGSGDTTLSFTTDSVVADVEGGVSPFSFSWTRVSGSTAISADSPSSQSTTFSGNVQILSGEEYASEVAVFRCDVTDDQPKTEESNEITVTLGIVREA